MRKSIRKGSLSYSLHQARSPPPQDFLVHVHTHLGGGGGGGGGGEEEGEEGEEEEEGEGEVQGMCRLHLHINTRHWCYEHFILHSISLRLSTNQYTPIHYIYEPIDMCSHT